MQVCGTICHNKESWEGSVLSRSPKKVTKSVNSVHLKPYLSPTSSQCHFDKDENRSNVDGPVEDDDFSVSLNMDCFGRCDGSKIDDGSTGEEGDDGCLEGHGCEGDDGLKEIYEETMV